MKISYKMALNLWTKISRRIAALRLKFPFYSEKNKCYVIARSSFTEIGYIHLQKVESREGGADTSSLW